MNFMIEAGMTPMEVLLASTANGADLIGQGDMLGTLEAGKMADIIVVNGNPLADFSVMEDVILVIKGGEVIDISAE
jgi:imidazolonepropionase-like amidohydrolase